MSSLFHDSNTVRSTLPGETTLSFTRVIGFFSFSVISSAVEEEEERVVGDSNTAMKQEDEGGRGGLGVEMAHIGHWRAQHIPTDHYGGII